MLTGISESFLQICNSAELIRSRLNQQTIQTYVRQYSQWSRTDILTFVNDAKNQGELKKKPALVLAFYDLLDSQLL